MSDVVRIKVWVNTGFVGAKHSYVDEIDKEDWDFMTEGEREDFLDDLAIEFRNQRVDCGAEVMAGDE